MVRSDLEGIGPAKLVPKLTKAQGLVSLALGPQEGFVLSRVDGRTSLGDICKLVPFDAELTVAILRTLWAIGAIDIPGATSPKPAPPPPPAEPPPKKAKRAKRGADDRAEPDEEPARGKAKASVEAPATGGEGLSAEQRRRIDDVFGSLGKADAFKLLEVGQDADKRDLKRAYFKLSKEFHPDRHFGKELGDYQKRLSEIFKAIKAAYELLNDDDRRKAYMQRGGRG